MYDKQRNEKHSARRVPSVPLRILWMGGTALSWAAQPYLDRDAEPRLIDDQRS